MSSDIWALKTETGRWSVIFIVISLVLLLGVTTLLANTLYSGALDIGNGIVGEFQTRPLMPISALLGLASGLISFYLSLLAIFSKKDRSVLVAVSAVLGLLLIVFLLGEFIFPH